MAHSQPSFGAPVSEEIAVHSTTGKRLSLPEIRHVEITSYHTPSQRVMHKGLVMALAMTKFTINYNAHAHTSIQ